VTIQAKVVDVDGSTIKQSASTVVTVLNAPQGSKPDEIKLFGNALGTQTPPFPASIVYDCGRFSDVTLNGAASVFNADRVKHQIVNVTSGAQLTPGAAPTRAPSTILPNLLEYTSTVLSVAELDSLNLTSGTFPWYGRHVFSLFTLERDGMTFMRPAVIDVIPFCAPN
jgi:hypothetical protein